jgi:Uncharacterized protein conserved in bacteria
MKPVKPVFFTDATEFRSWLQRHYETTTELWVGFYKKASDKPTITWPESVDQALCFGWIDGIRQRVDHDSYAIRFTPRRKNSVWSDINTRRARSLIADGKFQTAGLKAFQARRKNKSGIYSYEQRPKDLEEPYRSALTKHGAAWTFFQAQPPSYRRTIAWWIVSAKREETRQDRLQKLIKSCAKGKRLF